MNEYKRLEFYEKNVEANFCNNALTEYIYYKYRIINSPNTESIIKHRERGLTNLACIVTRVV